MTHKGICVYKSENYNCFDADDLLLEIFMGLPGLIGLPNRADTTPQTDSPNSRPSFGNGYKNKVL
jgi:hypothetical protein